MLSYAASWTQAGGIESLGISLFRNWSAVLFVTTFPVGLLHARWKNIPQRAAKKMKAILTWQVGEQ